MAMETLFRWEWRVHSLSALPSWYRETVLLQSAEHWLNLEVVAVLAMKNSSLGVQSYLYCVHCKTPHCAPKLVFTFVRFVKYQQCLLEHSRMSHQLALSFTISALSKNGLDQSEQNCTLCVHMFRCFYYTVHLYSYRVLVT